jgi:hypothetical protein
VSLGVGIVCDVDSLSVVRDGDGSLCETLSELDVGVYDLGVCEQEGVSDVDRECWVKLSAPWKGWEKRRVDLPLASCRPF